MNPYISPWFKLWLSNMMNSGGGPGGNTTLSGQSTPYTPPPAPPSAGTPPSPPPAPPQTSITTSPPTPQAATAAPPTPPAPTPAQSPMAQAPAPGTPMNPALNHFISWATSQGIPQSQAMAWYNSAMSPMTGGESGPGGNLAGGTQGGSLDRSIGSPDLTGRGV